DDTLVGPSGQRVVFGCNGLKHRLSPEGGSLSLTHIPELANVWVNIVRAEIDRDWTWKGCATPAVTGRPRLPLHPCRDTSIEDLPGLPLPHSVNAVATSGTVDREWIVVVYLDAFSAPTLNGRPYEIAVDYNVSVSLENALYATTSM